MSKAEGTILINGIAVADTKQCCHCNQHFVMVKGSGKIRGWCMKCHHITCGDIGCCKCVPFEEKLDLMEKGLINIV